MGCDMPNCAITLYYYTGFLPSTSSSRSRFSYYCAGSSPGWQVQADGSIHPPSKKRIVQIRLDPFPANPSAKIAGFLMGLEIAPFQMMDSNWTPWVELENLGVTPRMDDYPKENTTTWMTDGPLIFDMTAATRRLVYCLAVHVEGSDLDWDDPKIYDDGSQ